MSVINGILNHVDSDSFWKSFMGTYLNGCNFDITKDIADEFFAKEDYDTAADLYVEALCKR